MLYFCGRPSQQVPVTSAFMMKGLVDYTIGMPSGIPILGKPTLAQIAHAGYKANIEAFLSATANKAKVFCAAEVHPIPADYTITVPIPLPQTVFQLAGKPTPEMISKLKDKMSNCDIQKIDVGKGNPTHIVNKPSFPILFNTLPAISQPRCASLTDYAQVASLLILKKVYQCIDLFLATNTYSFKRSDLANDGSFETDIGTKSEFRTRQNAFYRDGFGDSKSKKLRTAAKDTIRRVDDLEEQDLTPDIDTITKADSIVAVAKPSPLPSSASWGNPSSVPNSSGLLFPYFSEMIHPDTKFVRSMVGKHFFRCLAGKGDTNARDAFNLFREHVGTAVTTPQGAILCHVLLAVDLALETQTQAYLLFSEGTYLGFCLLGEEFSIQLHGTWHLPLSPEALRAELNTLASHEVVLQDICRVMANLKDSSGDSIQVVPSDIDRPINLAVELSKISLEDSDEKDVKELETSLGNLKFPTNFRRFGKADISTAIGLLFSDDDLDEDTPIFLSTRSKHWRLMGSSTYHVMASFGSRAPHFRNAKGTEVLIPTSEDMRDTLEEKTDEKVYRYRRLIIYETDVFTAVQRWNELLSTGAIRFDESERSVGSRGHVFTRGMGFEEIWKALKAGGPKLKSSKRSGDEIAGPSKRARREAFVIGDADAALLAFLDS